MLELPRNEREYAQLAEALKYRWDLRARPNQKPPAGAWQTWLILAGRGFGKTRVGAEQMREWAKHRSEERRVGKECRL